MAESFELLQNLQQLTCKPCEYGGRKYPSMHALAEAYGLDVWGARHRLTLGVPLTVKGASWWQELWKLI